MTRHTASFFLVFVFVCFGASLKALAADADSLFVALQNGRLDVYPTSLVKEQAEVGSKFVVTTIDGQQHAYPQSQLLSVGNTCPVEKPVFTSFKFNNKFNGNVHTDVACEIGADGLITASVPAIGKWLTPSFQRSHAESQAYVGRELQHSKVTRRSFAELVDYVLTMPGWQVLTLETSGEGGDPVIPTPDYDQEQITLTADMLSTNAPTMNANEDLPSIIDGDPNTFYHSTWSGSGYEVLPLDSCPWIEVTLPDAIYALSFRYMTRSADNRWPTAFRIDVSTDGKTWKSVRTFTSEDDGMPRSSLTWWGSPAIDLGGFYRRVRFVMTACDYKNYLCLAELELYNVTYHSDPDPTPTPDIKDGESLEWQPYGTNYTVSIDWPTDRAVSVPAVYITTDSGRLPYDKTTYLSGTFRIDGAGVFPDMDVTPMEIRGRGNSSWAGENGKSPYRVKFASKQKPFGLTSGKNWILLANRQTGSMMSNAIGMKVGQLAGTAGANHVIPVELYINGKYRGSYNFTEKVGFSNNSIELDDESRAAMLELDSYFDEPYKFRGDYYDMPVNIKEPEFDEIDLNRQITVEDIRADWNGLLYAVANGLDISNYADIDTLAAFYLANEYILNQELMHPKSTFVYNADIVGGNSKWMFGPIWDLDWAFGYEGSSRYYVTGATDDFTTRRWMECNQFWIDIRNSGPTFDRPYYKAWTRFIRSNAVEELLDYCDEYYQYANSSFVHNGQMWGDGYNYDSNVSSAKKWLRTRADHIYKHLDEYDLSDELPEDEPWQPYEDDFTPTVTPEQYLDAFVMIDTDHNYRIFTQFNGSDFTAHKYYLGRDGRLTDKVLDDDIVTFVHTEGNVGTGNSDFFVSPAWRTDFYYTNPTLSNNSSGDLVPRGYISTNTSLRRDNWEGQVWYKDGDYYAVRSTNSPAGSWGAETYWTVEDLEGDGFPEAGYSWTPAFYWQLEDLGLNPTVGVRELVDDESHLPVYDLAGRRVADTLRSFMEVRNHRPGIYIVGGRKRVIK